MRNQLISDIKSKLKITGGHFVDAEISDYIANIPPAKYKDFFKDLSGDEFSFKNGLDRVKIVSDRYTNTPKNDFIAEAKEIVSLMHSINKTAIYESQARGIGYVQFMAGLKIRETFNLSDKQAHVINEIGGREYIMKVNETEPNSLERKVVEQLEKYAHRDIKQLSAVSANKNVIQLANNIVKIG